MQNSLNDKLAYEGDGIYILWIFISIQSRYLKYEMTKLEKDKKVYLKYSNGD